MAPRGTRCTARNNALRTRARNRLRRLIACAYSTGKSRRTPSRFSQLRTDRRSVQSMRRETLGQSRVGAHEVQQQLQRRDADLAMLFDHLVQHAPYERLHGTVLNGRLILCGVEFVTDSVQHARRVDLRAGTELSDRI